MKRFLDIPTLIIASIAAIGAVLTWHEQGLARVEEVLQGDLSIYASILPKVVAGSVIGAFVPILVRRETVKRYVGEASGIGGLLLATLLGALVPGGPLTIFPVAAGLLAAGADAGAVVAFITNWLLNGLIRIFVWEMPFMGGQFILSRLAAALPVPILAGLLARMIMRRFGTRLILRFAAPPDAPAAVREQA